MKKQTKRWLAAVLSIVLFAISLYTDAGITASAAGTKATKLTEVSIANLPKGNMLTLSEEKNYGQYDFDATKISGVLYWEVKKGTNTGVQSSYTGKVYPVTSGEFEIRVLAFRTRANRTKWLNARKANGYVADPKAETYVKAASDWVKITVKGEEGLAVAGTQSRLNKLLKDKNVKHIVVFTNAERDFVIGSKNYKSKTLTVNAPNADVDNQGRFAAINVTQIKDSTFRERAKGNRFHVTAPNARIIVEKGARVGAVSFQPDMKKDPEAKLNLEVNGTVSGLTIAPLNHVKGAKPAEVAVNTAENANVSSVKVEEAAALEVKGESTSKTKVTVEESAEGTVISAKTPIEAELKASVELKLDKGAKTSVLTLLKAITAIISGGENGSAENVTVKMEKEAEGAKLETAAKVEIQTKVKVEITLNEGAEGSSIVADLEVTKEIKVENQTKEDVEIKDETGEVTTTVGSGSDVQVTPAPTTPPSTGTSTGTPGTGTVNPPSTSTPTPTPEFDIGKMTYTLDGKKEEKVVALKINEHPFIDEHTKADIYYIAEITAPQGTRVVEGITEIKELSYKAPIYMFTGDYDPDTGVMIGLAQDGKKEINVFTVFNSGSSKIQIQYAVRVGQEKITPGTPTPGTLHKIWYETASEEVAMDYKKVNDFTYETEVSIPENTSSIIIRTEEDEYYSGIWDFKPGDYAKKGLLIPKDPDKNTVLLVNLIEKRSDQEPGEVGRITYTLDGKTEEKEAIFKVNEHPILEEDDVDTYYIAEITAPQGTRVLDGIIKIKEPSDNFPIHMFTLNHDPETGALIGISLDGEKEMSVWTHSGSGTSKVQIQVKIIAGEDKIIPGTPTQGILNKIWYETASGEEVVLNQKKVNSFTYEAEVSVPENMSSVVTRMEVEGYYSGYWEFKKGESEKEVFLIPKDPDKNTILIIKLIEKKNQDLNQDLTIIINPTPTIVGTNITVVSGSATTVSPSAIDSGVNATADNITIPTEAAQILNVQVEPASGGTANSATATVKIKFKNKQFKGKYLSGTVTIALQAQAYRGENPAEDDSVTYTWSVGDNAVASNANINSKTYTIAPIDLATLDTEQSFTISVTVAEKDTAQTTK